MIIGLDLPEGSEIIKTKEGRVLIVFDEHETKRDLWKAAIHTWVTDGKTEDEFYENPLLDNKRIELSYKNKLKMVK